MAVATATTIRAAAAAAAASSSGRRSKELRVAVVGGGIAGTLCSLVLRNRGIASTVLDAGAAAASSSSSSDTSSSSTFRDGPKLPEFIRTNHARLASVLTQLEQRQLVARWGNNHDNNHQVRWGMLGATAGGFLPAEIVAATVQRNPQDDTPATVTPALDAGDFCGLVNSYRTADTTNNSLTYVPAPHLLSGILDAVGVPCWSNQRVDQVEMVAVSDGVSTTGGWRLHTTATTTTDTEKDDDDDDDIFDDNFVYDGLVLATGDPSSLASQTVRSIGRLEQQAAAAAASNPQENGSTTTSQLITARLFQLADALQALSSSSSSSSSWSENSSSRHDDEERRRRRRMPLYKVSVEFPSEMPLPFDAVSVHGSSKIQYLVREQSKPWSSSSSSSSMVWTAISTSQLAATATAATTSSDDDPKDRLQQLRQDVLKEMIRLFQLALDKKNASSSSSGGDATAAIPATNVLLPSPDRLVVTHEEYWEQSSIFPQTLELQEDCIMLEPWRLALAGSYLKSSATSASSSSSNEGQCPWEAAAVSGLEAGERMAAALLSSSSSSSSSSGGGGGRG